MHSSITLDILMKHMREVLERNAVEMDLVGAGSKGLADEVVGLDRVVSA
jgi:hypothetical protein